MGHIKEPEEVNLNITSEVLTEQTRLEISKFISNHKKQKTSERAHNTRPQTPGKNIFGKS